METSPGKEDKLLQQFNNLQQDWDSYKQSNPRTLRRCSTDTFSIFSSLDLLNNSPRNLMSSLQHRSSPSEGGRPVRNIDLAGEEIRRERKAAIESGKVKGRRLFEALLEGATEVGFGGREEMCSGWSDLIQESEVKSVSSYASDDEDDNEGSKEEVSQVSCLHCCSCSSSSVSSEKVEGEKVVVEGEKVAACLEEKRGVSGVGGYGGRWMVFMACLAIASIVFALGIISARSFDGDGNEDEVIMGCYVCVGDDCTIPKCQSTDMIEKVNFKAQASLFCPEIALITGVPWTRFP